MNHLLHLFVELGIHKGGCAISVQHYLRMAPFHSSYMEKWFHFSDRTTYNLWKKTKVETLSAVCTKNQNSKTVIKTIIDGGHLGKIIDQK
jgi:hypothetical protein